MFKAFKMKLIMTLVTSTAIGGVSVTTLPMIHNSNTAVKESQTSGVGESTLVDSSSAYEKENLKEIKNIIKEDKKDTKDTKEQQLEPDKIISQEIKSEVSNNNIVTKTNKINAELIKIRINNCFVNAKKEYLQ